MEENDRGFNVEQLKVVYYVYLSIALVCIFATVLFLIYKIKIEVEDHIVDVYKVIQYIVGFIFLVVYAAQICIPLSTDYPAFISYLYINQLVIILFYAFVTTNIAIWVNSILHISWYIKPPADRGEMIERVLNNKENERSAIAISYSFVFSIGILSLITLWSLFSEKCFVKYDKNYGISNFQWQDPWTCSVSLNGVIIFLLLCLGIFQIGGKIFCCIYLCKYMECILYQYYTSAKKIIIITTVVTVISLIFKIFIIVIGFSFATNIGLIMIQRNTELLFNTTLFTLITSLLDLFCQLFIIIISIKHINFKGYLYKLMEGRNVLAYFFEASIFIKKAKVEEDVNSTFTSSLADSFDSNTLKEMEQIYFRASADLD